MDGCFACLSVCIPMPGPRWPRRKQWICGIGLQIVVNCHLGAGNWSLTIWKTKQVLLNRYVKQSLLPWSCSISQAGLELTFSPGWLHNGNLFQGYRTSSPCPYPRISLWSCLFTGALLTYNSPIPSIWLIGFWYTHYNVIVLHCSKISVTWNLPCGLLLSLQFNKFNFFHNSTDITTTYF